MQWTSDILTGFGDRMKSIAVYAPIFDLKQKTKYKYDLPSLAISVMLFIMEDMIRAEKNCTYESIAHFLHNLVNTNYEETLTFQEALDLSYYLVRDCLMNEGRPHQFDYRDFETGKDSSVKFHLVELESYQVQSKTVRLKLSSDGLEMLFKTKEIYGELQVTIAQLYLRQQIQKGVFDGALRAVEELSLAVRSEKERLRQLEERIIRDVLQVAREHELEKQFKRIDDQLDQEQRVFQELAVLIDETMREYHEHKITAKEERAVETIAKVRRRLFDVIHDHESLFKEKLRIHQVMLRSVEARILTSFTTKVNFETEFLRPVVQKNADIITLKQIIDPVLPINKRKFFHPGRIFMEQPLRNDEDEDLTEAQLWEIEEELVRQEEEEEKARQQEKENFLYHYFNLLLKPLVDQPSCLVSTLLHDLKDEQPEVFNQITARMDFYSFLVQLHQFGDIPLQTSAELDMLVLDDIPRVLVAYVEDHEAVHELKAFYVQATNAIITLPNGFVMSDFIISRKEEQADAI